MSSEDKDPAIPKSKAGPSISEPVVSEGPVETTETPSVAPEEVLEPDTEGADTDSAYGESGTSSVYTASLTSGVRTYQYENGRRYHAFREGEYPLPNDEQEQDRLDLLHHIWKLLLGGKLYKAPIPENPQRILDFGTGTGIWAIDCADEFPSAAVVGTDLSPIQPSWVPPNCSFFIDDSDGAWSFRPDEAFDFIHGRAMGGSIKNWNTLYDEIYKNLKPGGWVEIQEYETWLQSDDGSDKLGTSMMEWQTQINEAAKSFGKAMLVAEEHKESMIRAGFVDVVDFKVKVPVGPWPKDPKAKEIGRYEMLHMIDAVEPFSLALLHRVLGWSVERIQVLGAGVRADFRNPKIHLFSYFHFVYGRKPDVEKEPEVGEEPTA